jgi:hypothetical protein
MGSVLRSVLNAVKRPSAGHLKALGALCMLVALFGWALASPVGASPDEDYHIASIWCSHGERTGVCEMGPTADTRLVPSQLTNVDCFAFKPAQSAACLTETPSTAALASTDRGNFNGNYPPVFYWVAGTFVGDSVGASVLTMRLVNAFLYVALVTAVYLLVSPGLRRPLVAGALITAVPLGMFLIPSINPSSWAVLSATTLFISLVAYLTAEQRRRQIAAGVLAGVSLLVGAGARADAAAYGVVAVVAAVILTWRREMAWLRRLAYPGLLAIAATVTFLLLGQSDAAGPSDRTFGVGRFLHTLIDIPALWIGAVGSPPPQRDSSPGQPWGLGWLDTAMPGVVWVGIWGIYAATLYVAVAGASRRRSAMVAFVATATLLIPAYVQYQTAPLVGQYVQPRYVLPLLILLAITALVRLDGPAFRLTRGQRWIIVTTLTITNAVAVYMNVRRYVTGIESKSWNLDRAAQWWWNLPITPLTVCFVTAIAFGAGAFLLTTELTTEADAAAEPVLGARGTMAAGSGGRHRRVDTQYEAVVHPASA